MDTLLPEPLVALARRVVEANAALGRTLAVAESCTGGLVSAALTEIPGSSAVLNCSFVTYSNAMKETLLGVNEDVMDAFGSVSIATAWAMARGALERSDADVAVAITGIAGPDGGSELKPVGTVVFARAERGQTDDEQICDMRVFANEGRASIRLQAALCALELLLPLPSTSDEAP